ncbi:hypothetical protein [Stakelama saccharophila]|uniref:Rod shape-determining protein MreD n=1 Tax=Stakelama saccharophila TaxID=3075605 RepID=A0ABZ0BC02_9SPHN|nr:hypothetical protein [Stakelama sp. W311]WNO54883.1 hypothetical protein RPR59_06460 [Stakelama sp. W311]
MTHANPLIRNVLWPLTLAIFAVAGSMVFKCMTPFVAVAVVAAVTMDVRRGALTAAGCWALNQASGYCLSGYPVDQYSLGWGAALGGGTMLSYLVARWMTGGEGATLARTAIAAVAAYVAYEASLYAVALAFGGVHTFTADIVLGLAVNNAVWLAVLLAAQRALSASSPRLFGKPLRLA